MASSRSRSRSPHEIVSRSNSHSPPPSVVEKAQESLQDTKNETLAMQLAQCYKEMSKCNIKSKTMIGLRFENKQDTNASVTLFVDHHYGSGSIIAEKLILLGPFFPTLSRILQDDSDVTAHEQLWTNLLLQQVHVRLQELSDGSQWLWYGNDNKKGTEFEAAKLAAQHFETLENLLSSARGWTRTRVEYLVAKQ